MIFGKDRPKIVGTSDTIDYNVNYARKCVVKHKYNYQERDGVLHKSILTGKHKYHHDGDHSKFELIVIKPSCLTMAEFNSHYNLVHDVCKEGAKVTFSPNQDVGSGISCYVLAITPFYYKNSFIYDAYKIKFISEEYVVFSSLLQVSTPAINPSGTIFWPTLDVTISCSTPGAVIYYTDDGSTPTMESNRYTGTITLTQTTILKAKAFKGGLKPSVIASESYECIP